jgi:hypothetical protein
MAAEKAEEGREKAEEQNKAEVCIAEVAATAAKHVPPTPNWPLNSPLLPYTQLPMVDVSVTTTNSLVLDSKTLHDAGDCDLGVRDGAFRSVNSNLDNPNSLAVEEFSQQLPPPSNF